MQELNSQAQDLVDAGHFDPNAVEETRIVMEERFVIYCCVFYPVPFLIQNAVILVLCQQ